MLKTITALAVAAGATGAFVANYPLTHLWAGPSELQDDGTWYQSYTYTAHWLLAPWFAKTRTVWYKNQRPSTLFEDPRRDLYLEVLYGPLPYNLLAQLFWRPPVTPSGNFLRAE